MWRSQLVEEISKRRDANVSVRIGRQIRTVKGIEYDPTHDRIIINTSNRNGHDLVDSIVTLVSELDRGLQHHDVGHSVWYEDWRARVEAVIGLEAGELNTANR